MTEACQADILSRVKAGTEALSVGVTEACQADILSRVKAGTEALSVVVTEACQARGDSHAAEALPIFNRQRRCQSLT